MSALKGIKNQKRLAADILKCGRKKIWLDPKEISKISKLRTRYSIKTHIKMGFIIRKPNVIHSRFRTKVRKEAIRKGRSIIH